MRSLLLQYSARASLLASLCLFGTAVQSAALLRADAGVRSATLTWHIPSGVNDYVVYVSSAPNCDIRNYTSCPDGAMFVNAAPPYVVKNLRNGQPYYFRVEGQHVRGVRTVSEQAFTRPNVIAFDNAVKVIAPAPDGSVYLAGLFKNIGVETGGAVPVDMSLGQPALADFPIVAGKVNAVVPDRAGGFFVGGEFTQVGTFSRRNLVHILASGVVDPAFSPNLNGAVNALALDGGALFVGGAFTIVNDIARNRAAAFNFPGSSLNLWNPDANGPVHAIAPAGNTVYLGGEFTR